MRSRAARGLIACALVGCGARTELGAPQNGGDAGGDGGSCAPAAAAHCAAWKAGASQIVYQNENGVDVAGAVSTGCDALVSWFTPQGSSAAWTTRVVGFDGAPIADAKTHPIFATSNGSSVSLAANGARIGALESATPSCGFLVLDDGGAEVGSNDSIAAGECEALAGRGSGFSFVRIAPNGDSLMTIDANDQATGTPLALPTQQAFWDRVVFDDGSFLVSTFQEDSVTAQYTNWLTPFDAGGNPIGPQLTVDAAPSAPVQLVATKTGALAMWTWDAVWVRPVDRHGAPTGAAANVTGPSTPYHAAMFSLPNGDVLLVWIALETTDFSMYALSLGPDGVPYGGATILAQKAEDSRIDGAVESGGARALIVTSALEGVRATPLTCAP